MTRDDLLLYWFSKFSRGGTKIRKYVIYFFRFNAAQHKPLVQTEVSKLGSKKNKSNLCLLVINGL